jgi:DNA topoisomerase-1
MRPVIIIAEKPDAAARIAAALTEGKPKKSKSAHDVDYWEFERGGRRHLVVAAVGHLFGLKQDGKGWSYPVFDVKWAPAFSVRRASAFSKKYFMTLRDIATDGSEYIIACDYDNEGSLIGWNVLRFICKRQNAKRMKFSTLTKPDLIKSYETMSKHLDWQNIECGLARHMLDFYYGINSSRALTLAIKKTSPRFAVLSAGRVQGPVLCMLAQREAEIARFKPKPYWQLRAHLVINGLEIAASYVKAKIWKESEAKRIFASCDGKAAIVKDVVKKKNIQPPPAPFNITSLQTEAYRLFGYSPQQTLRIAQNLYTSAYVSYPRTSSEKLPVQIGYKEILTALSKIRKYAPLCKKLLALPELRPVEGKRTDPAHEAIRPTSECPKRKLSGPAAKIYDLICRRFFSAFAKAATRESMRLALAVGKHRFTVTGRRTLEPGWMEFYGPYAKFDETVLPDMKPGDRISIKKLELLTKQTAPPPRFSQAAIIKEMERRRLGTRATRAQILQTLYDRNYIADKAIRVTDLGMKIAKTLRKYVPDFVDEKLTRKFELELERIFERKVKKEKVLADAKRTLVKICQKFRQHEAKIGKELGKAIIATQEDASMLGPCPGCGGSLKVMFSPWTKKKFVGCSSYSRCKVCGFSKSACKCSCHTCGGIKGKCMCNWKEKGWTPSCTRGYPLPHNASFQRLGKICEHCKTPIVQVIRKGKRPFRMCLAPDCETKKDWGKAGKAKTKK